jgi:Domain of unknown function (DUF4166)/Saccharopine dehydrogenase NADP binding domain
MKSILLLGATGMFGRRLADRLVRVESIRLIVASRSQARAEALANRLGGSEAVAIDTADNLARVLAELKPFAVIDCSGPFQGAGYGVAKTCIEAGCHLIDIADARDYLLGFEAALNTPALQKNVTALSGVSSTPCLSTAVVKEITRGWKRIDTIDMAIAPDGHNDIGLAVAQGTLSYAGKPVNLFRHGRMTTEPGWLRGRNQTFAGVGTRHISLAETVDADIMPRMFGVMSRVAFSAGLFSQLEHRGLQALSWLRAKGTVKNLMPFAPLLVRSSRVIRRFGGNTGGMRVCVQGLNSETRWCSAEWSLAAKNGEGPYVPILPIVAAVKLLLRGDLGPGARMAAGEIPLSAITDEMRELAITTQLVVQTPEKPIFDDAVPPDQMDGLPAIIRQFHDSSLSPVWTGHAKISRSSNLITRVIGKMIGLPDAASNATVRVSVERDVNGTERWTRMFNGKAFHSIMNRGPDNSFWERFGLLNFKIKLHVENGKLIYPITKARFFGLPVPRILLPTTEAFETIDELGRFVFDVRIALPIGGVLVHYQGWLQPVLTLPPHHP